MAFFEYVPEDQVPAEAKEYIEAAKKRARSDLAPRLHYVMTSHPRLLKAFVQAFEDLIPVPNRFGTVQFIASMLIAHAKGCRPCLTQAGSSC